MSLTKGQYIVRKSLRKKGTWYSFSSLCIRHVYSFSGWKFLVWVGSAMHHNQHQGALGYCKPIVSSKRRRYCPKVTDIVSNNCHIAVHKIRFARKSNPMGSNTHSSVTHYRQWAKHLDVVMCQQHKAGENIFVDWQDGRVPIHNPITGETSEAHLFLAVLRS